MSVGNVTGGGVLGSTAAIAGTRSSSAPPAAPRAPDAGAGAAATVSRRGMFLSQIVGLSRTDPKQAQQLLGQLATTMRGQASEATGEAATRIGALADLLQNAADTGDLSPLLTSQTGGARAQGPLGAYQALSAPRR